ncbi:MATE family efflux transporter [uncultured Dubosiella sp.]|uniref:MATE family efflux transporter n=1 Tax=uncultured Dubosiella sp. TaxID=1937011 RepID=UPI0025B4393C|nr:MATE family efflux transporter [uncultured Dubosiella sp.]
MKQTLAAFTTKTPKTTRMFTNKALGKLIVPLVVEQVLVMLIGMIDTIMVSFAGEAAISGVALVDMINNLFITVLASLATGGAVIVSQYLGSKNKVEADLGASQLILSATLAGTGIGVFCLVFRQPMLTLFYGGVEADVMEACVVYFLFTLCSFPFLGLYNAGTAIFRSMQKTGTTMVVSLFMNILNLAGNYLGVFVFQMGVAGVAIPTLVSRMAGAFLIFTLTLRPDQPVQVRCPYVLSWQGAMQRRLFRIAVPNGIENGLFMLGKVLVTSIVALFGTTQIAANGVSNSLNTIAILVVNAINLAIVTVVGQCVGARELEQARAYTKKLMKISYVATAALSLLVWAILPLLLRLYDMSEATYTLTFRLILIHNALALALHPTSFNLANAIRAAGDVRYTMWVGIASMLVFRLGCAFLFGIGFGWGIYGVWLAMGADWLGRSIAFLLRYHSGEWLRHRAI